MTKIIAGSVINLFKQETLKFLVKLLEISQQVFNNRICLFRLIRDRTYVRVVKKTQIFCSLSADLCIESPHKL